MLKEMLQPRMSMNSQLLLRPSRAALLSAALFATALHGQTYNFNDGTDGGLTRYDPLTAVGLPPTFSFPGGNTFRVQSPSTAPFTAQFGPTRAGAIGSLSYGQFSAAVDLVGWDPALDQGVGLVGRIQQPGLGTSDGYGFLVFPRTGGVAINRFDNEAAEVIGLPQSVTFKTGVSYRLEFTGDGASLQGRVIALNDPALSGATVLTTVTATDATYGSGFSGLLVAADLFVPTSATDATFDNLVTAVPEPGVVALGAVGLAGLLLLRRRA
jgi:hypothetical protein